MLLKKIALIFIITFANPLFAQERFIGEVYWTAGSFCPKYTLEANGALIEINDNMALFSVIRQNYGGNGSTVFALPDLRVAAPVSEGQAPTRNAIKLGQKFGGVGCPSGQKCGDEYQSYLGLRACIVSLGIYPPRN